MANEQRRLQPVVSGISPKEGMPGTTIKLRGENLGVDPNDLVALIICDTDCLLSAQWKSSKTIVARVGQAKRGIGEIVIVTKSGGRGISNVQFRVIIEQVGPLVESPIWVDESRTVPTRSAARQVTELPQNRDALGIHAEPKPDPSVSYNELSKLFPDASGNLRMDNFNPAWYLLENHKNTSFKDLQRGIGNLKKEITKEHQSTNDTHKSNLYSLIDCVDALYNLHMSIESDCAEYGWPLTSDAKQLLDSAMGTADGLFSEVLSRKDRADCTRNAMSLLTRFRFIFFLIDTIDENMKKARFASFHLLIGRLQGDYASILNDYARAKALFKDSDTTLFKEILRVLEDKMQNFKDTLKQKLIDTPASFEEQSRLIKYLKILDPSSNPAWECITAYHCWLEKVLWELQNNYSKQAAGEDRRNLDGEYQPLRALVHQRTAHSAHGQAALLLEARPRRNDQIAARVPVLASTRPAVDRVVQNGSIEVFGDCDHEDEQKHSRTGRPRDVERGHRNEDAEELVARLLNDILCNVAQVLSSSGYPGEEDLFLKENIRQVIVNRFIHVVCTFKDCCDLLLKGKKRPNKLNMDGNESGQSDERSSSNEPSSRKLLICVCNLDYVLHHSLPIISSRFSENGIKYADLILEVPSSLHSFILPVYLQQSKHRLSVYQGELISKYLEMKRRTAGLAGSRPQLRPSAGRRRRLVICERTHHGRRVHQGRTPLVASTSHFRGPLLLRLLPLNPFFQILSKAIEWLLASLLRRVAELLKAGVGEETATQTVIDLTALERTFEPFLSERLLFVFPLLGLIAGSFQRRHEFHSLVADEPAGQQVVPIVDQVLPPVDATRDSMGLKTDVQKKPVDLDASDV
ncbi:Exocyst complex component 2 [Aphelenchoides fujianensis]|nr:Exocyst complex component 2 [Aphelenchoides fujianensis]